MILAPCRDASDDEIPTTAGRLRDAATQAGWTVRVTYAKAELDDKIIESVLVRLCRPPLAAVGAWHGSKFAFGYVGSLYTTPQRTGFRDLTRFVKGASS